MNAMTIADIAATVREIAERGWRDTPATCFATDGPHVPANHKAPVSWCVNCGRGVHYDYDSKGWHFVLTASREEVTR